MRQIFCATMLVAVAFSGLLASVAHGQERIRIGVLNDQSGVFATYQGVGSVIAAQMAVEDYGGQAPGKQIEVVTTDHHNKTDEGGALARPRDENAKIAAIFDPSHFPLARAAS